MTISRVVGIVKLSFGGSKKKDIYEDLKKFLEPLKIEFNLMYYLLLPQIAKRDFCIHSHSKIDYTFLDSFFTFLFSV